MCPNSADPDELDSEKKTTDLNLHHLQKQGISGFSKTRVKINNSTDNTILTLRLI